MKETEIVKDYADRLMKVVNQIRLLGEDLPDKRVVEKVLVSLPEKFESKISSLEDLKDLGSISLAGLVNALHATEQRRLFRQEEQVEGALFAKGKHTTKTSFGGGKKPQNWKKEAEVEGIGKDSKYPPCPHCKKKGHPPKWCWYRPGVQCRTCKEFGHVEKVCKNQKEQKEVQLAKVAEDQCEEHLFSAQNQSSSSNDQTWLLDSGCTHHMSSDADIFVEMNEGYRSKVKVGNGEHVAVKGIGKVSVQTPTGPVFDRDYKTKTIQACAHGDWSHIILNLPSFSEYTWSRLWNHALRIDKCLITYRAQCPINSEGIVRVQVHDTRVDSDDSRQAEYVFPVTCNVNVVYYGSSWSSSEEKQFPWSLMYRLENTNIRTGVKFCKLKGQLKLCSCPKATEIALRSPEIQIMSSNFSKDAVDVWHVGYVNLNPALNRCLTVVDRSRMSIDSVRTIPGLSYHDFSRRSLSGPIVDCNTSQNLDVKPEDSFSQVSSSRKDESLVCSGSLTGHQIVDIVKSAYDRGQNDVKQKLVTDNSKS